MVLQIFGGFENIVKHINDVLALVALQVVWAGAAGNLCNPNVVNVACGAGHSDCFFGTFGASSWCAINDEHTLCLSARKLLEI